MNDAIFIKDGGQYVRINHAEIAVVEACGKYVKIITEKKYFLVQTTMKRMETLLPADRFVRIHKSFIVSLSHISSFTRQSVLLPGRELPIGDTYRTAMYSAVVIVGEEHTDHATIPLRSFCTIRPTAAVQQANWVM